METRQNLKGKLLSFGIGRRKLDDAIFINDKPPLRLGVYDDDDENLCHDVVKMKCNVPGCVHISESLLEFEAHYNSSHRYTCAQCKKMLPSPHFLDLHLQENHDSFFAVMALKKASYCCYIQDCKEKFMTAEERHDHAVKEHKLPKDFRFEQKPKNRKKQNKNKEKTNMEIDPVPESNNKIIFSNSKQKTFAKYSGKKFTGNAKKKIDNDGDEMDISVSELKEMLPN